MDGWVIIMLMRTHATFAAVLALGLLCGCGAPPRRAESPDLSPLRTRLPRERVFQAARVALKAWGEEIVASDPARGTMTTRSRVYRAAPGLIVNYRLLVSIKRLERGGVELELSARGDKLDRTEGYTLPVDETDAHLRPIVGGILSETTARLLESPADKDRRADVK